MTDDAENEGPRRRAEVLAAREAGESTVPLAYEELKAAGERALSESARAYVSGGAGTEETMAENRRAFERWRLRPRMLEDVSERSLSVELFGREHAVPFLLAPIGLQTLYDEAGEVATAAAAGSLDVPLCLSGVTSKPLEAVAEAHGDAPRWFQLYWWDREVTESLIDRAEKAGYEALVLTVDAQIKGWRVREMAAGSDPFREGHGLDNFFADPAFRAQLDAPPEADPEAAREHLLDSIGNLGLTWDDLSWLDARTDLPILLKGILHPADAERARAHDAVDGVVVSNHGGRQVDGSVAALDALPAVVDAVDGELPVLFDSGIRTGPDVLRALALGADAVLLGRPYVYGLALAGEAGVEAVLKNVRADVDLTLGLSGYADVGDVGREAVVEVPR